MPLCNFRQICLPYCVKLHADGSFEILNREYQPLGTTERMRTIDKITYNFKGMRGKALANMALNKQCDETTGVGSYWLYDDGCTPDSSKANWDAYQKRLQQLNKLTY